MTPDPPNLLLIVVGSQLRAEVADRPLAYGLQAETEAWMEAQGEALRGPVEAVVCSDIWYMNQDALHGRPTARVIVRFDWDLQLGTNRYYSDHAFFSEDACQWLVDSGCRLIALDTPQPDDPKNGRHAAKDAPNHKILLGQGTIIAEYLVNIREIRSPEVQLVVAPIRLIGGDGAPARIFAIEED